MSDSGHRYWEVADRESKNNNSAQRLSVDGVEYCQVRRQQGQQQPELYGPGGQTQPSMQQQGQQHEQQTENLYAEAKDPGAARPSAALSPGGRGSGSVTASLDYAGPKWDSTQFYGCFWTMNSQ